MSANAPWSVKGIDAKAREVAKDLARRSGMTLGEWLNQMILEGEDVGAMIARERDKPQRPTAASRPPYRDVHPAYDDEAEDDYRSPRRPVYREAPRRPAPFSSTAQPLSSREPRRSIFEGRPRFEDTEDEVYASASGDLGRVARALEGLGARIESSEGRSANAVRGVSHAVESLLNRLERSEAATAETQGRLDEQTREIMGEIDRLGQAQGDRAALAERLQQAERLIDAQAERLEGLSGHVREDRDRLAKFEEQLKAPQAIETVRAVEGALGKLANQLYEGDIRSRETVRDIREDMLGLSHRLTQIELRDPERVAQGVMDKVVARLSQRLEAAEAQTTGAIRALEQAFATMDKRLTAAEGHGDISDPEAARSFRQLAADLSRRVEDSRAELKTALQEGLTASSEQALKAVNARIEMAEKRSAAAIERLGQDMVRVAEGLNRRVAAAEASSQDNFKRVAEAVDQRFGQSEAGHAQALERLGGEIARISERLTLKLNESERRTAQVLNGVGEQIEQQRDHVREDLSARIRQSEERTAKLLEEARARIDQKLAQVQTQSLLSETVARAAAPRPADDLPNPFAPPPVQRTEAHQAEPVEAAAPIVPTPVVAAPEPAPPPAAEDDIDFTGQLLAPVTDFKPEFDPFEDEDDDFEKELTDAAPAGPADRGRFAGHTTPVDEDDDDDIDPFADLDTSRKTAPAPREPRPASSFAARPPRQPVVQSPRFEEPSPTEGLDFEDQRAPLSLSTRDALAAARAAVRAASLDEPTLDQLKPAPSRSRSPQPKAPRAQASDSTITTTLKATGLAVGVVLLGTGGIVGYQWISAQQSAKAPPIVAAAINVSSPDETNDSLQNNLKAQYDLASSALAARAPGAVDKLKVIANQGYAPAEFNLGGLYSGEGNLVKPDPVQARLWTQRAAEGGIAKAMHNVALMYYQGQGGPQDRVMAAMWYRKAAERGIEDSQYNLGVLYQSGDGVAMNLSEAYKWLSLAAKSGDSEAAKAAATVKAQLSDSQVQKIDTQVNSFVPISDGQPPMADSNAQSLG